MMPRDREAMVNEAVQRITNGLGSPQSMLRLLGDIENVEDEVKLIEKWKKFLAEVEAPPQPFGDQGGNVGSGQGRQPSNKKTETSQTTE